MPGTPITGCAPAPALPGVQPELNKEPEYSKDWGPGSQAGDKPRLPASVLGPSPCSLMEQGVCRSRSFASSAFPLGSGKGADLGMCLRDLGEFLCDLGMYQRGTHQIPCLAGMKSPCFMGWWGKKPGQTPVSLSPSSYWLLRKPGCPFFSGKHGAHGPPKMWEKYERICL